jgi:predicted nucleotidyltransferase
LPFYGKTLPINGKLYKLPKKINLMRPEEKILFAYYELKTHKLYFNQIANHTKLSHSSIQNALLKLPITLQKTTGNVFHILELNRQILLHFQLFDYQRLQNIDTKIKFPIIELIKSIPREIAFALFFGSASRNEQKKGSDLDILIVLHDFSNSKLQKVYDTEIRQKIQKVCEKVNEISHFPLNIFITTTSEYIKATDPLILQAKTTGYPIVGYELYYETTQRFNAAGTN